MTFSDQVADFFLKLEGPYKWYVLAAVLIILTAMMTRVIFKTFKWFLLIVAAGVLLLTFLHYFTPISISPQIVNQTGVGE